MIQRARRRCESAANTSHSCEQAVSGQIVESTPSGSRRYYLVLKADAGSVPCSTLSGQMAETVDFRPKQGTPSQNTVRN